MLGVSEGIPHPVHLLLPLSVRSLLRQLLGDCRSLARGWHYIDLVHRRCGVQAMHRVYFWRGLFCDAHRAVGVRRLPFNLIAPGILGRLISQRHT